MPSHLRLLLLIPAAMFALQIPTPATAQEKSRTFTSTEGKKIKATLLEVAAGKAKLKLASGRAASIPVTRFAEADQAYINAWAEKRKKLPRLSEISTTVKKIESFKREGDTRVTTTSFEITVTNNSTRDIAGVVLDTNVFWKTSYRGFSGMEERGGRAISLGTLEKKELTTQTLGPFTAVDVLTTGNRRHEKIQGVVINVEVDDLHHSIVQFPNDNIASEFADYTKRRKEIEERMEKRQEKLDIQDAERGDR